MSVTRDKVLGRAVDDCIKELYTLVQPSIEWDEFVKENKIYSDKYKIWERFNSLYYKENKTEKELEEYSKFPDNWKTNNHKADCIGPAPYEFYYLPKEIMKEICDSYVYAYKMDSQQNLLDIIEILKNYCKEPMVDKYINSYTDEKGNHHPGYRDYARPDNLAKEIAKIITNYSIEPAKENDDEIVEIQNKFFEFLDMAGNFFCWNRDLNTFNGSVYLGPSPNSNKENVIKNWKKYRNQDIEIDESKWEDNEEF